jgi:hypothetical protein
MHPEWLKSVVWGFEQRPEATVIYGAFVADDTARTDRKERDDLPYLCFWPYDCHAVSVNRIADIGCIAHRAGLAEAHFDETLREMGDWDLFLRLTRDAPPLELPAIACFCSTDAPDRLTNGPTHAADLAAVRAKNRRPLAQPQPPMAIGPTVAKHRFQSFWWGDALTPYELCCLKSFIDHGHAFDLYSFQSDLAVPAGVRLCNAAEVLSREGFFVYREEGFGKGSPSAFANLFRYKLLAEKGGWWVDTDVLCRSADIPIFAEFFARQDGEFINTAVLFFEPRHPLMVRCFEEATRLGPAVRWGDGGPRLFTRMIKELNCEPRALPSNVCYPVHFSEAVDVLRPSKSSGIDERTAASPFIHLWNETLRHGGVQKTNLPPKGSMLRRWFEQHGVNGWRGEYDPETLEHALLMQAALHAREEENRRLAAELDQRRAQTVAMLNSTSWLLTRPLRAVGGRLGPLRSLIRRAGAP